jgi:hypothetical protein
MAVVVALGREGGRWVEVAFFLISNGRVRRGDLSRRAAPAEAGFRRLKPPPRPAGLSSSSATLAGGAGWRRG